MAVDLQAVVGDFQARTQRVAVFDKEIRERTGEWTLADPVPVDRILRIFQSHPALHAQGNTIRLPLHEADAPTPTGEYLTLSRGNGTEPSVTFHDFGSGGPVSLPLETFSSTYPASRLRLWADHLSAPAALETETDHGDDPQSHPHADPAITGGEYPSLTGSPASAADLFDHVRSFLDRIRDEEKTEARQRLRDLSPSNLPASHPGIPACRVQDRRVGRSGRQVVTFEVAAEAAAADADVPAQFGLYPGSVVLVRSPGDAAGFPVEATVESIDGNCLDVVIDWESSPAKGQAEAALGPDSPDRFALAHLLNPIPFDRQAAAVDAVEASPEKRALVVGERSPDFASVRDGTLVTAGLDEHQETAVDKAHRADDLFCIHGPPGTGKTRTLRRIIKTVRANHGRVLACAHSNQAVDNLIAGSSTLDRADPRSLHAAAQEGDLGIARVGDHSTNPVVQEYYTGDDHYHQADVVATTTSGAHRFQDDQFDVAVVDEATQATIPATFVPYSKARRLILAGDHRQLPPYHSTEQDASEDMAPSLFEHVLSIHGGACRTMLQTQYRMNEAIAAFPNGEFYDDRLSHGETNRDWTVGGFDPLVGIDVDGVEAQSPGNSYYNEAEALAVAREVSRLLHGGVPASSIGIITPYSAQIGKIRAQVDDVLITDPPDAIQIDTVDSFQGGQRDVIVVSFVRSNGSGRSGFLTFPDEGPRRLNVALTRARKRLVVIANWDTLRTIGPGRTAATSCAPLYDRLYQHLAATSALEDGPIQAPTNNQ